MDIHELVFRARQQVSVAQLVRALRECAVPARGGFSVSINTFDHLLI